MLVTIRTVSEGTSPITIQIEPEQITVLGLKQRIEAKEHHPVPWQRLIFSGRVLDDESLLSKYITSEKDFLVLVIKKPRSPRPSPDPRPSQSSQITNSPPMETQQTQNQTPAIPASPPPSPKEEVEVPVAAPSPKQAAPSPKPAAPKQSPPKEETPKEVKVATPLVQNNTPKGPSSSPSNEKKRKQDQDVGPNKKKVVNHSDPSALMSDLSQFVGNEMMSDVTFLVGKTKEKICGHCFLLGARSKALYSLLYEATADSADRSIEIPDVEPTVFRSMLAYLYTGAVSVNEENCVQLMASACKYGLDGLNRACIEFSMANLEPSTVLEYLKVATVNQLQQLSEKCMSFIDDHAEEVLKRSSLGTISKDLFAQILIRDNLKAKEIEVFEAVLRWKDAKEDLMAAKELAKLVRIPQIGAKDIIKTVKPSKLVSEEVLFASMAFHAAPEEFEGSEERIFRPRV